MHEDNAERRNMSSLPSVEIPGQYKQQVFVKDEMCE